MDNEIKAKWVAALRSGEYHQTTGKFERDGSFCCLGVLCEVTGTPLRHAAITGRMEDNYPGLRLLGLEEDIWETAYVWNDTDGKTFPEIADLIESTF